VDLSQLAGGSLVTFVLVLGRVGGLFVFAPFFSARMIPIPVKMACAAGLAVTIAPLAAAGHVMTSDGLAVAGLLIKEMAVGLAMSFAIGAIVAAVQAGAGLLDALIGFSFAAIIDPITNLQNAILGQFYSMFAVMIVILTGGDHFMVEGMAASYRAVPLDSYPSLNALAGLAMHGFASVFVIGLELTAPVLIAVVIVDAAFALMARAAPQMNVYIVGLPAKIATGFVVLAASLPFLATHLQSDLESAVRTALNGLGVP